MPLTKLEPIVAPAPKMAAFPIFFPNFLPCSSSLLGFLCSTWPCVCAIISGMLPYSDGLAIGIGGLFSSMTLTYERGNMPSKPVLSLRPFHPTLCQCTKMLGISKNLQSLFMCSVTWILSPCWRAKSPVSVGMYAYSACAVDKIEGATGYAGGAKGAGVGVGEYDCLISKAWNCSVGVVVVPLSGGGSSSWVRGVCAGNCASID